MKKTEPKMMCECNSEWIWVDSEMECKRRMANLCQRCKYYMWYFDLKKDEIKYERMVRTRKVG